MEQIVLDAERREKTGSAESRRMRAEGWIPANLYGHGEPNMNLRVRADVVTRLIYEGHHMMSLNIDGKASDSLLKEIQFDTYGDHIVHLDFARISLDEVVEIAVPVETQGNPKGVSSGGVLDVVHHEVAVRGPARALPEHFVLEISDLEMGAAIRVSDLELPDGVEALLSPGDPVVILHPPRGEEPDSGEDGPSEPEVIGQNKDE